MKFHAAYIHWIYLLQGVNLSDYNFNNLDELLRKNASLNDYFYNIHVERANVLLIVNNGDIVDMTYKLIGNLITYKSFIDKNLLDLQFLLNRNKSLIDSFLKLDYKNPDQRSLMKIQADEEKEVKNEITLLNTGFREKRTEEFLKCRHLCDDFAKLTKTYLLSID